MEERYYYKTLDGKTCLNLKEEMSGGDYIQITKQEYELLTTIPPRPKTQKEIKEKRIAQLKQLLRSTDYQAIKYAEGFITENDYAEIKAQRQSWRDEINTLESEIRIN